MTAPYRQIAVICVIESAASPATATALDVHMAAMVAPAVCTAQWRSRCGVLSRCLPGFAIPQRVRKPDMRDCAAHRSAPTV